MKYYHNRHELYKVDTDKNIYTIYIINCGEIPIPETVYTKCEEDYSAQEEIEDLIELNDNMKEISKEEFDKLYNIWYNLHCEWMNFKHKASIAIGQFY